MPLLSTSQTEVRIALSTLIDDLGRNGGLMSPSLYDTAQVMRLGPSMVSADLTANWLCQQQAVDGGWGTLAMPLARDVSTLAVVLALHHVDHNRYRTAIERGLAFLHSNTDHWSGPLGDDIPGSVEITLPSLLLAARNQGLVIDDTPYQKISRVHDERLTRISRLSHIAGTTAAHAWEGWGTTPTQAEIDASGSVGHSPAATAAWLGRGSLQKTGRAHTQAVDYLRDAARATGSDVPGVVPTAWPIPQFELCFGLYALVLGGLLDDPELAPVIQPRIASLCAAVTPRGLGMSDAFQPDGDDTAVALAVLATAGQRMDTTLLDQFLFDDHYVTWPHELQPSLSVNVHAIHARSLLSTPLERSIVYVLRRQAPDGRWLGDKWHASWIYSTSHAVIALHTHASASAIERAINALIRAQHADGGWGITEPTAEETAYALLALYEYASHNNSLPELELITRRGHRWLQHHANAPTMAPLWLGKEPYSTPRIVQMFVFAALLRGWSNDTATT